MKGGVVLVTTIVIKRGESIDKALNRFKNRVAKEGIMRELKKRAHFEKPSEKKRKARARKDKEL
ncbi:30S ribosomal protein S21 [PVC group bacterium]|nr:30S ribosomal protein S21 [PVC group bacterium]MCH7589792.1 30S ribosomal protein S21 [PVC group bacterium]